MRKEHVIWLLHRILSEHQVKAVTLRNDNGSQFIAHAVRHYLKVKQVEQEFIHIATPEENCFIEAYHSIVQWELLEPRQLIHCSRHRRSLNAGESFITTEGCMAVWLTERLSMSGSAMKNRRSMTQLKLVSINGERKSLKIEESRFVDKIVHDPMTTIFEDQRAQNAQTVPENLSS